MKKLVTVLLLVLATCFVINADNPLRLKSGTLAPLKGKGGVINCNFDFSKTKGNRKPLEKYIVEDYGSDMETFHRYEPEMNEWFHDKWNEEIEEGPQAIIKEDAKLQLKVVVKTMQLGAKSGWGGSSISGYAEFYQENDSVPFAVVEILKMHGTQLGGPVSGFFGLKQVFNDLAEYLCDLIYHY